LSHFFTSLATLRQDLNEIPAFKALSSSAPYELQLLVILLLMTLSLQERFELQEHYSSDASSFLFVDTFALFCSFRTF